MKTYLTLIAGFGFLIAFGIIMMNADLRKKNHFLLKPKPILEVRNLESKIFRNDKNLGLTKNLNFLIKQSRGEYIARQDSDDTSHENRLDIQVKKIINTSAHLVTSRALIKGSNRKIPGISFYLPLFISLKFKDQRLIQFY